MQCRIGQIVALSRHPYTPGWFDTVSIRQRPSSRLACSLQLAYPQRNRKRRAPALLTPRGCSRHVKPVRYVASQDRNLQAFTG